MGRPTSSARREEEGDPHERDDLDRQADPITAFHADVERLIERAGMEWTFVRPSMFASNTLMWEPRIRADGVVRWPYGESARSPVHEREIAAVAVRALTGEGHAGARNAVTGPQSLTQVEQVIVIGEAIGRSLRPEKISREEARRRWLLPHLPPAILDGALDRWARCMTQPEAVSPAVEALTGSSARTLGAWATDHAGDSR